VRSEREEEDTGRYRARMEKAEKTELALKERQARI
jgi:hypothetical protein